MNGIVIQCELLQRLAALVVTRPGRLVVGLYDFFSFMLYFFPYSHFFACHAPYISTLMTVLVDEYYIFHNSTQ